MHRHLPRLNYAERLPRTPTLSSTPPPYVSAGQINILLQICRDEALSQLKSLASPRAASRRGHANNGNCWNGNIRISLPYRSRPDSRLLSGCAQPIARICAKASRKQVQHACLHADYRINQHGQRRWRAGYWRVENYDADRFSISEPQAQPLRLIIPRLHLCMAD